MANPMSVIDEERPSLLLPRRKRGRPTPDNEFRYRQELDDWCDEIQKINSGLDFRVSSRGWCYILEEHGLTKGDFDAAQRLINDCRKSGRLPLDICSEDEGRAAANLEEINDEDAEEFAAGWVDYLDKAHEQYVPISFWDDQPVYIQMTVEKVDLKSLFAPICEPFHIPISNISGWNDINSRAAIMRRFRDWERKDKHCILLHCGDHDPGGLHISEFLHSNLQELAEAVDWEPDDLLIERFGLNADFIEEHGLTWIENLETSSGGRLDDPKHPDHNKSYVIREFGVRKCEANALVVRADAGRELCRAAILRHVLERSIEDYEQKREEHQERARAAIARLMEKRG
jgi:hypothetical protein